MIPAIVDMQATPAGSVIFAPRMGGLPRQEEHAQHAGNANDRGRDSSLPELAGGGSTVSETAAMAEKTKPTAHAPTEARAAWLTRFGEAVPHANVSLMSSQLAKLASRSRTGDERANRGGGASSRRPGGKVGGTRKEERRPDEQAGPTARMRALFHPPTDLGTLAESDAWRTLPCATQEAAQPPAEGATVKERLTYIGKQLDAFGRRGLILERYEMLGGDDRCRGGVYLPDVRSYLANSQPGEANRSCLLQSSP